MSNIWHLPHLLDALFGYGWGLGWVENSLPGVIGRVDILVVGLLLIRGLMIGRRPACAGFLVAGGALIVVPLYVLQQSGAVVGSQVQPRYLYPLALAGLAVAFGLGEASAGRRLLGRRGYAVVAAAMALTNAYALWATMSRYTTGLAHEHLDPGHNRVWWWHAAPFSPLAAWLLGSIAGAVAIGSLLLLAQRSEQEPAEIAASQERF